IPGHAEFFWAVGLLEIGRFDHFPFAVVKLAVRLGLDLVLLGTGVTVTGCRRHSPLASSTPSFFMRSISANISPGGGPATAGTSAPASLASGLKNSRLVGVRKKI